MGTYAENFIKAAFAEITPCNQIQYDDPDEEENDDAQDEEEDENEATEYCQAVMEDDAAEEAEEDDAVDTSWYTYDIKEADDIAQVCVALNALDAETLESTGHIYDEQSS